MPEAPQLPIEHWDSWLIARNKINNSRTKLLQDVEAFRPSIWENWNWYIWTTDTGIHAEWYTTSFRVDNWYIQYKEENSNVWNNLIAVADLKWDTGNWIESVTATKSWKITTVTLTFTEDETPYTFQISDGADWQNWKDWKDWKDWTDWQDWKDWEDGTDGVGIAWISTSKAWKITTVTVSYTDESTPDSFEISDWADWKDGKDWKDGTNWTDWKDGVGISDISTSKSWKITTITISYTDGSTPDTFQISDGQDGRDWEDWQDGADWNGIASVTSNKSWKVTTVTLSFTDGTTPPFSFTVSDWQDWEWSWDVLWPNSSVDWNIVLFDWVTGKLIKDWNKKISDFATSTQWWKADTALQPNDAISKLNNDSWFQTQQQVNSAISTAIAGKQDNLSNMSTAEWQWGIAETQRTMTAKNLKEIIQYYTSTFITNSVSDLTNYYLKSETYTKAEVASLIWSIQQFHYEIFANISDITSPASNVLYLIWPKGSGPDLYEEYVYTTQFIKIWETSIDLSNYVTITALNTALSSYVTSAVFTQTLQDYVTTTNLSQTLSDYVTSSGLNTILVNYVTTTSLNSILEDYATTTAMNTALAWKIDYPSWWTVWQALKKTANWAEWWTVSWWHNYAWETKTISNSSLEIWLRTIVDNPTSNFTLTAPATLEDWMEYVLRCINTNSYTITLWTGFTNPRWVDLKLTSWATDQFVFVAIWWILELQAEIQA